MMWTSWPTSITRMVKEKQLSDHQNAHLKSLFEDKNDKYHNLKNVVLEFGVKLACIENNSNPASARQDLRHRLDSLANEQAQDTTRAALGNISHNSSLLAKHGCIIHTTMTAVEDLQEQVSEGQHKHDRLVTSVTSRFNNLGADLLRPPTAPVSGTPPGPYQY
jgi:hypothetical protein